MKKPSKKIEVSAVCQTCGHSIRMFVQPVAVPARQIVRGEAPLQEHKTLAGETCRSHRLIWQYEA